MPATASTAEDRDTFEFEPLDLNLESSDPIDMDGSGLLKFFDVFEPIHMDYDDSDAASSSADAAACTAADHNWNNSMTSVIKPGLTKQKADSVIRLRFSEMTQDTEQILQGIMDDAEILMAVDEDEAAEGQGNAAAAVPPPRASITLTNIVEAPETATGTTEHLSNNNPVISDTDDEEPIPFAYNTGDPHGGGRRRSSIMSIRPSLLSPELADKLLAGIMEIDTQVLQANTATNSTDTNENSNPTPVAFESDSDRPQKKKRSQSRFSMTAINPHEFFGPGGTPIGTRNGKRQGMRYSIAQHTLDLFDDTDMSLSCHEEDGASLADDDEETFRNEHAAQPVQEVTNATLKYYRKETKEVHAVHEQALAQEMAQLSFEDKHRIMFDIHGMPAVADSTPYSMGGTEIEMKEDVFLKQMEAILVDDQQILQLQTDYWTKVGRVPLHPKIVEEKRIQNEAEGSEKAEAILQAYREAEQTNPQYVRNTQLRLMFLKFRMQYKTYEHDELLYAKMAAMQLAYHFYVKKKLFGGGAILGRDVHLSDFNTDDRKAIESGGIQIMPTKDAAGRIVMMFAPDQKLYKTDDNWIRCLWYMFWQVSKDGGDLVRIHTQPGRNDPISLFNSYMMTKAAFPLKTKAIHWCYDGHDESAKQVIIAKKVHFYNQNERSHFREHFTTDYDDMCFRLETFGISIDRSIFLPGGRLGLDWHMEWLKTRELIEEEERSKQEHENTNLFGPSSIIVNKNDVLFGRGKNTREHTGNLRCAYLVEVREEEYNACRKAAKTKIAEQVVTMVLDSGGRFLKKDTKGWHEVDRKEARNKVAHFFRHLRTQIPKSSSTAAMATTNTDGHSPVLTQKRTLETATCLDKLLE